MENEEKNLVEKEEKKEIKFSLSGKLLNIIFSLAALVLFALVKIIVYFGVGLGAGYGVFALFIYALAIVGVVWAIIREKKVSIEFVFDLAVLILVVGIGGFAW